VRVDLLEALCEELSANLHFVVRLVVECEAEPVLPDGTGRAQRASPGELELVRRLLLVVGVQGYLWVVRPHRRGDRRVVSNREALVRGLEVLIVRHSIVHRPPYVDVAEERRVDSGRAARDARHVDVNGEAR